MRVGSGVALTHSYSFEAGNIAVAIIPLFLNLHLLLLPLPPPAFVHVTLSPCIHPPGSDVVVVVIVVECAAVER